MLCKYDSGRWNQNLQPPGEQESSQHPDWVIYILRTELQLIANWVILQTARIDKALFLLYLNILDQ